MKLRVFAALAGLTAVVLGTSGCAPSVSSATPTPVDFKACMVSSPAGFNDGGISEDAYYGLLQSRAQYGVATSALQLAVGGDSYQVIRAAKKLVSRGCNLIFAVGDRYSQLATLANGNPKVQFVELDPRPVTADTQPTPNHNLLRIVYDYRVAYLQAGYLAAALSKSGSVGIIGASGDPTVADEIWYFRQGVYQYAEKVSKLVGIVGAQGAEPSGWKLLPAGASASQLRARANQVMAAGADVILPIGVDAVPVAQVALAAKKLVIGSDSDWATQKRFEIVKDAILASVTKAVSQTVAQQVAAAMGVLSPSPTPEPAYSSVLRLEAV
ncbi:MAG: hypothetical protein RL243_460, partial [Actinomycetota bacterium]